jgi:hypothetical protein
MKYIITIVAALAFAGTSYAGCGKKSASIGTLEKYDAETKTLIIKIISSSDAKEVKAKTAKLTMTPDSKVIAEGKIASLVGKSITVVAEHGKIDYVIPLAPAAKKEKG